MNGTRVIASSGISTMIGAFLVEVSNAYHSHKTSINRNDRAKINESFESMEKAISFYSEHLSFSSRRKAQKCLVASRKVVNDIEKRGRIDHFHFINLEQVGNEALDKLGREWGSSF